MELYLNRVDGIDDGILTMYYSKRSIDREFEKHVRETVSNCVNLTWNEDVPVGAITADHNNETNKEFFHWLDMFFKMTQNHITIGRFVDFSFTVYGLHRAGQDDWDAHAKRMENRIIRSSTRLADFNSGEMSDYYKDKILPTDIALTALGIITPEELEYNGKTYVKAVNGYILKGLENKKDVKRGLYMLSIPSNFIFKINLTEASHIFKERRPAGTANPEVKETAQKMLEAMNKATAGYVTEDLLLKIKN